LFWYCTTGGLSRQGESGDIVHGSEVVHGNWSFDVFISDKMMAQNRNAVMYDEEGTYGLGILIKTKQNTVIHGFMVDSGVESNAGAFEAVGKISGWNHFYITRNEEGHSTGYLKGEPILEYKDELSITPYWFYFSGPIGPSLDIVIVRDQVIDIQAPE